MRTGPSHLAVSERTAHEFLFALATAFASMDPATLGNLYLLARPKHAIAISYDQALRPFVGQTRGYNLPRWRTYLDGSIPILQVIRRALVREGKGALGGRVFLTSRGVYLVDEDEGKVQLVDWEWPDPDLVEAVLTLSEMVAELRR